MRINGIEYNLIYKNSQDMNGTIGLADFNRQEISINNEHTLPTQKIATLHEILHILSDSYNLKLSEEQVVYTTHALLAFMADNKNLTTDFIHSL